MSKKQPKMVTFRGREVIAGWPEKVLAAQAVPSVKLIVTFNRLPYRKDEEQPCHDCAVIGGEFHVPGCDSEECPACHGQLWMGCDCEWPRKGQR